MPPDGMLRRLILPLALIDNHSSMSTTPNFRLFASYDNGTTFYEWKQDHVVGAPPTAPPDTQPPITDKKLGTIVPLYTRPSDSSWVQLASIAQRYPRINTIAIVNPNSGPGASQDAIYTNGIRLLKNNAIRVLGYVATGYGGKSETAAKAEIDKWKTWYPDIDGIFFDEMANTAGKEGYYNALDAYVKSKGMTFTCGNPGASQIESYFSGTGINCILVYENQGYPSVASLKQTWMGKYERSRFGVIPYSVSADATACRNFVGLVAGSEKICGYVYCQTDTIPNPWDSLSSVFEVGVQELDRVAASEGTTSPPPEPTPEVPPLEESGLQISITSPADGATIAPSNVVVKGNATGAVKVEVAVRETNSTTGTSYYPATLSSGKWQVTVPAVPNTSWVRILARATSSTGATSFKSVQVSWQSGTTPPTTATTDKFGINKIYPTAQNKEWYIDMANPKSDTRFKNLPTMTKQADGSWRTSASQVRMEAWSPTNDKWLNVEITGYAKLISGSATYAWQFYSRGGHHYSDTSKHCEGSAMKGRFYSDGRMAVVKEINHPAYCGNRGIVQATNKTVKGRWVGMKVVIYNYQVTGNPKTFVAVEDWIDDDVTDANGNLVIRNNWKKITTVKDEGGWGTNDSDFKSDCPKLNKDSTATYRQNNEILNLPGGTSSANLAAWRTDGVTVDWKFLSVREIVPPSHD